MHNGCLWTLGFGHHTVRSYFLTIGARRLWKTESLYFRKVLQCSEYTIYINSFGMCRMWRFLAILRSFFHSSLLCTFSCHPFPPAIHPSSLTSSCHLFLGLPLSLVVLKFTYNTLLGILFSSILCTCPNQLNPFNLIVYITVGFFFNSYWSIDSNFLFHCHILGLKFFYTFSFQKCSTAFYLSFLVNILYT
jgi:hypothetical protein